MGFRKSALGIILHVWSTDRDNDDLDNNVIVACRLNNIMIEDFKIVRFRNLLGTDAGV